MSDNEKISLTVGDKIKFQLLGTLEETGVWALPKLKERTYIGVRVYAKNDMPLKEPVDIEVGFIDAEWQHGKTPDITKLWSATLKNGISRATVEKRGEWVGAFTYFLDLSTLEITSEAAPKTDTSVVKTVSEPESPKVRSPWYKRAFGNLARVET